jgi:hypothetical protein
MGAWREGVSRSVGSQTPRCRASDHPSRADRAAVRNGCVILWHSDVARYTALSRLMKAFLRSGMNEDA